VKLGIEKYLGKETFYLEYVDCSPDITPAIHYARIITLAFLQVSNVTFSRSVFGIFNVPLDRMRYVNLFVRILLDLSVSCLYFQTHNRAPA